MKLDFYSQSGTKWCVERSCGLWTASSSTREQGAMLPLWMSPRDDWTILQAPTAGISFLHVSCSHRMDSQYLAASHIIIN